MVDERQFYTINASDVTSGKRLFGPFDAGQKGVRWHRARLFGSSGNWSIGFFAAEQPDAEPVFPALYDNPDDILLYAYKGRYLWVVINSDGASFERLRLYYPAHSFTRYLPEVYQAAELDSFFPRFLAIFQSVFLDLDEKIADFPKLLDPAATGITCLNGRDCPPNGDTKTYLPMLAGWLGCEEFDFLPESAGGGKRAEFLLRCVEWYKGYGTRAVMSEALEWLCGFKPYIVEYIDFEQFAEQDKITNLFPADMFTFTVLLYFYGAIKTYDTELLPAAEKLLEKMKPAYTVCNLVTLEPEIRLDGHSYLDFNSVI